MQKTLLQKIYDLVVRKRIDNKELKEDDLTPTQLNVKELANSVDERDSMLLILTPSDFERGTNQN